eukprot:CAMPEP_0113838506 /NCGR_PEP_ID=MMETSP0328-20130328/10576_1 /TAXON_ID=39455 /ORGANISM="Alexandrium minutum" /LENGTH=56 /DNA_ID=CAMNT_0000807045 /DNA_START=1 /DNA_END=168 /DNA_ORIENTATION=- /assembly_acc=CAM_ASM_000350
MCMTLFANEAGARLGGDQQDSEEEEGDFEEDDFGSAVWGLAPMLGVLRATWSAHGG